MIFDNSNNEIIVKFIPKKHWWNLSEWELVEPYTSSNKEVVVPVGTIVNGANIPWFARFVFSPTGRYFGASIIHDFVLQRGDKQDWKEANKQFLEELNALGINTWRKKSLVAGVKVYYKILRLLGKT